MIKLPLVSITITTKNEAKNIERCLQSIKAQTYPSSKIEIIVVDNNSKDLTKQIAQKFTNKVYNRGPERSAQRNFGMLKKSLGKYLMFLDADMTLSKKCLENCVKKLEKSSFAALYIPEIIIGKSFWAKVRNFERSFYNGTVVDCVRFIRKEVFVKTNGFDESLTGPEDWDLDKRIRQIGKVTLLQNNQAVIYHYEEDFNFKNYFRKKNYYIKSFNKYKKKWGKNDPDIKKQFSPLYRYFGVFIENGKWQKILYQPMLFLSLSGLRFLVGLFYINSFFKIFKKK